MILLLFWRWVTEANSAPLRTIAQIDSAPRAVAPIDASARAIVQIDATPRELEIIP